MLSALCSVTPGPTSGKWARAQSRRPTATSGHFAMTLGYDSGRAAGGRLRRWIRRGSSEVFGPMGLLKLDTLTSTPLVTDPFEFVVVEDFLDHHELERIGDQRRRGQGVELQQTHRAKDLRRTAPDPAPQPPPGCPAAIIAERHRKMTRGRGRAARLRPCPFP